MNAACTPHMSVAALNSPQFNSHYLLLSDVVGGFSLYADHVMFVLGLSLWLR